MRRQGRSCRTGSIALAVSLSLCGQAMTAVRAQETQSGSRATSAMAVTALVLPTCAVRVGQTRQQPTLAVTCNRSTGYLVAGATAAQAVIEPTILTVAWSGHAMTVLSLDF